MLLNLQLPQNTYYVTINIQTIFLRFLKEHCISSNHKQIINLQAKLNPIFITQAQYSLIIH